MFAPVIGAAYTMTTKREAHRSEQTKAQNTEKGMFVGLKQPRGNGERYVTPARAAAKETTLYSPREVKIREITIHEPSSFLKRGHKLQSIHTICVDSIVSTTFSTHPQSPDQLYFLNLVPRSLVDEAEGEIWQSKKICFS